MKSVLKRLEELEKNRPATREPQFFCWGGQEWTKKEEEMMKRKYPNIKIFWKPLSKTPPYGYERQGKEAMALFKDLASLVDWDPEKQRKHDDEIRKRVEEESRMINERWSRSKDRLDE